MLRIKNLQKSFGELEVLKGIDLEIPEGQVVAIIGPSGAGKSTLLRCINFLEIPQQGTIELSGAKVDVERYEEVDVRSLRAKTSMVFQNYNLFANKTCLQNVLLPLEMVRHIPKKEALAVNPKCILFDEPTSSLDPELVYEVQEVIRQLAHEKNDRIMVIVTHEMNFAKEIAHRIIYMEEGKIVIDEPTNDFFSMETNSLRIKRFLEKVNIS